MTSRPLQRDTAYSLLSDPIRRAVVSVSSAADGPISLSQCADAVAADRPRTPAPTTEIPSDSRRLRVKLHHVHLPKLDAAGVLSYDSEERSVSDFDVAALAQLSTILRKLEATYADRLVAE